MPHPTSLGALREHGHVQKSVRTELRENLLARLRAGETTFPGLVGLEDTVVPQVERAILAGHDLVLLGQRGQGKTRLLRSLVNLLDEWTPVIVGSEINEHPYEPILPATKRLVAELEDATPVTWLHRSHRYGEKLATPDTSVGDLIGDVDPAKVAEGRSLGDPETMHYGLIPRTHRGIVAVNELPDLAERIQVALLNVLEERDVQVRGYTLRLNLDVLIVASANPEDYTNRGRIITPLKDRFGAEVRTHYPLNLEDELTLLRQEAVVGDVVVPEHLLDILARFTRAVRESPQVDKRSGVSARFSVAAVETVAASALRRQAITGEPRAVARTCDLASVVPAVQGKVEFDVVGEGAEGSEAEILEHLLRKSTAEVVRARLGGVDLSQLQNKANGGIQTGDRVAGAALLAAIGKMSGLSQLAEKVGVDPLVPEELASAVELALEGLYLTRRLGKDDVGPGRIAYGR